MFDFFIGAYLLITLAVFCFVAATSEKPYGRGTTGEANFEAAIFSTIMWPGFVLILALMWLKIALGDDQ